MLHETEADSTVQLVLYLVELCATLIGTIWQFRGIKLRSPDFPGLQGLQAVS